MANSGELAEEPLMPVVEQFLPVESVFQDGPRSSFADCERRAAPRFVANLNTCLLAPHLSIPLSCSTRDYCEGGMYVFVPNAAEIAVGRRVQVSAPVGTDPHPLRNCLGDGCFATVLRTERLSKDDQPLLGVSLRFDQPVFL
jgi:hypothetical protein